jgi:hypothetical protein
MSWGQTPANGRKRQGCAFGTGKVPEPRAPVASGAAVSWVRPRTLAFSDAYFLDLMKATRALALAMGTDPGGMVALMTPFGKPFTICLSGSRIDSRR